MLTPHQYSSIEITRLTEDQIQRASEVGEELIRNGNDKKFLMATSSFSPSLDTDYELGTEVTQNGDWINIRDKGYALDVQKDPKMKPQKPEDMWMFDAGLLYSNKNGALRPTTLGQHVRMYLLMKTDSVLIESVKPAGGFLPGTPVETQEKILRERMLHLMKNAKEVEGVSSRWIKKNIY